MNLQHIGQLIATQRRTRGLTQAALAARAGIGRSTLAILSHLERTAPQQCQRELPLGGRAPPRARRFSPAYFEFEDTERLRRPVTRRASAGARPDSGKGQGRAVSECRQRVSTAGWPSGGDSRSPG